MHRIGNGQLGDAQGAWRGGGGGGGGGRGEGTGKISPKTAIMKTEIRITSNTAY